MSNFLRNVVFVIGIFTVATTTPASAAGGAGVFGGGRSHWVISGGNGYAFDQSYWVLGVGVNYNLIDGLGVGLHVEKWSGAKPAITKLTPSVQYVFHQLKPALPYVGGFARRVYIDGYPDIDSTGTRAGVYFTSGRNAYFGGGVVRETYKDCSTGIVQSCTETYPQFTFAFVF